MDNEQVSIRLLGRFDVDVDGRRVPEQMWTRRSAAALVKVVALAPGHRLHREQVMDLLWPDDGPDEAAPKLHKAAHFARKAAGPDCVVLRSDMVMLFPTSDLRIDVTEFDLLSQRALVDGAPASAQAAISSYGGDLLPGDLYEEWAIERRELLRLRHLHMLRLAGRWVELAELHPSDEDGRASLMQQVRVGEPSATTTAGEASTVSALIFELAELTARQAALMDALAAAAAPTRRTLTLAS